LQSRFDALKSGETLTLEPRTYQHSGVLRLRVAGARVNVKLKNMSFVTTTDVIGNYRLSTTIDPDQSEVSCSKEGYRQSGTMRRSAPGGPKGPVEIDCTLQPGP